MKVCVKGLSQYSDTLQIETARPMDWRGITALLNIEGVKYYVAQGGSAFIAYSKDIADVQDVAAQSLCTVARYLGVSVTQLDVIVRDEFVDQGEWDSWAEAIMLRAQTSPAPAAVPAERVIPRGSAPAYWLA